MVVVGAAAGAIGISSCGTGSCFSSAAGVTAPRRARSGFGFATTGIGRPTLLLLILSRHLGHDLGPHANTDVMIAVATNSGLLQQQYDEIRYVHRFGLSLSRDLIATYGDRPPNH